MSSQKDLPEASRKRAASGRKRAATTAGGRTVSIDAVHLYPTTMNTYGDRGNVAALTRRAALRGIALRWHAVELGDEPPARTDLIFMGGGQDRVQHAIADDLRRLRPWLQTVIADGSMVFAVCAGLQLLGRRYVAADGSELAGLGLLDLETVAAKPGEWRLIGNVVAEVTGIGGGERRDGGGGDGAASDRDAAEAGAHGGGETANPRLLAGFENHGGRTWLGGIQPLGRVLFGSGNNGRDGGEGVNGGNVIATYLHGPVLPKNAWLTDYLLARALTHAGGGALAPLAHAREDAAQLEATRVAERDHVRRRRRGPVARLRERLRSLR
jgi:CobQ-like glutamine amidotransferase family enzyme